MSLFALIAILRSLLYAFAAVFALANRSWLAAATSLTLVAVPIANTYGSRVLAAETATLAVALFLIFVLRHVQLQKDYRAAALIMAGADPNKIAELNEKPSSRRRALGLFTLGALLLATIVTLDLINVRPEDRQSPPEPKPTPSPTQNPPPIATPETLIIQGRSGTGSGSPGTSAAAAPPPPGTPLQPADPIAPPAVPPPGSQPSNLNQILNGTIDGTQGLLNQVVR